MNAAFLGHADSNLQLSGFGLGSLTLGIFMLSIGASFGSAVGTLSS